MFLSVLGVSLFLATPPHPRDRLVQGRKRGPLWPVVGGLVGAGFLLLGEITVALAAAIVAATVSWFLADIRKQRSAVRWDEGLAAWAGSMVAALSAGATPSQACERAFGVIPDRTPAELIQHLGVATTRVRSGTSVSRALTALEGVGPALVLSERHGISLIPLFQQIQRRIDMRLRHSRATGAALQGAQATAVVLSLLPVAGIVMGTVMGAHPLRFLGSGGIGGLLLVGGVLLTCAGFWWSRIILRRAQGSQHSRS